MNPTADVTDRKRFLNELNEIADGQPSRAVPVAEIARRLQIPPEQAVLIAESLCSGLPGSAYHGLVECGEDFSQVSITPEGLAFLEESSSVVSPRDIGDAESS